jgi:protocatechuate 3,4-dioxygenase, beta subunit
MDQHERKAIRRELLRLGLVGAVATVWSPTAVLTAWAQPTALPTTPTTIGPFYPVIKPLDRDSDLTRLKGHAHRARGQVLHLAGRIVNVRGEPVAGARVELWQANAAGRYDHPSDTNPAAIDPDFQGYGEQVTDREGRFRFTTIKPGPYPTDNGGIRTPHIHFDITGHVDRRVTQLFFSGEPLNEQDRIFQQVPRNRAGLVADLLPAPPDEDPAGRLIQWTVVLPRG